MHLSVVLIGVGGASCSGKTTLAKHLRKILPNSFIVHQDDFAPPQSQVPIHPIHDIQDWDAAPGAIDWQRFVDFLRQVKATGVIPNSHYSHDHLNEQEDVPISDECAQKWAAALGSRKAGTIWIIVDGFLLFWHPEVVQQLDVKILLRVPHDILEQRRKKRSGYHTAVQSDPEGSFWQDPPLYWDQIVYPAYVDAHQHLFENGDVERGKLAGNIDGLLLLEMIELRMDSVVDRCCGVIQEVNKAEEAGKAVGGKYFVLAE